MSRLTLYLLENDWMYPTGPNGTTTPPNFLNRIIFVQYYHTIIVINLALFPDSFVPILFPNIVNLLPDDRPTARLGVHHDFNIVNVDIRVEQRDDARKILVPVDRGAGDLAVACGAGDELLVAGASMQRRKGGKVKALQMGTGS
jgi:hypothetical protein